MKKHNTIQILKNGICELWYIDEHSVEHSIIATLSPTHLPDGRNFVQDEWTRKAINLFNVNAEIWQTISVENIIDIEQLTGEGAENNKKKLQASDEYMAGLFDDLDDDTTITTDEDFYSLDGMTQ